MFSAEDIDMIVTCVPLHTAQDILVVVHVLVLLDWYFSPNQKPDHKLSVHERWLRKNNSTTCLHQGLHLLPLVPRGAHQKSHGLTILPYKQVGRGCTRHIIYLRTLVEVNQAILS